MPTLITQERADTADASMLVEELDAHLETLYPIESRHGLSVQRLISENVAFFVSRHDGAPAGCGGIKFVTSEYGEIKRMYVRPQFRGLGLGKLMLNHLIEHALARNINVIRLETGIHQHQAIRLYEGEGFLRIPPFPPYREDPNSRCYEKRLA
jgi:ribosomal protein S18 acetylase RimI-like enzyme